MRDGHESTLHIRRRLKQTAVDKRRYLKQLGDCLATADVLLDAGITARQVIELPQRDFIATMWMLLVIDLFLDTADGESRDGTVIELLELSPSERSELEDLFALIQDRYYGMTPGAAAGKWPRSVTGTRVE